MLDDKSYESSQIITCESADYVELDVIDCVGKETYHIYTFAVLLFHFQMFSLRVCIIGNRSNNFSTRSTRVFLMNLFSEACVLAVVPNDTEVTWRDKVLEEGTTHYLYFGDTFSTACNISENRTLPSGPHSKNICTYVKIYNMPCYHTVFNHDVVQSTKSSVL